MLEEIIEKELKYLLKNKDENYTAGYEIVLLEIGVPADQNQYHHCQDKPPRDLLV